MAFPLFIAPGRNSPLQSELPLGTILTRDLLVKCALCSIFSSIRIVFLHLCGISFCGDMEELTQSSVCVCVCVCLSCVQLFATSYTVARQAPLSMEFSRQEYWSGLPFPSPGDLPDPRIKPSLLHCRQMLYCLS